MFIFQDESSSNSSTRLMPHSNESSSNNIASHIPDASHRESVIAYRLESEAFTPTHMRNDLNKLTNHKMASLFERYRALYDMTKLPEEHPFFLPEAIARHAKDCLAVLVNNSNIETPNLINRGGEALSFTWQLREGKAYLTIDDTDVDFLEIGSEEDTTANLITDGEFDWPKLLPLLSGCHNGNTTD